MKNERNLVIGLIALFCLLMVIALCRGGERETPEVTARRNFANDYESIGLHRKIAFFHVMGKEAKELNIRTRDGSVIAKYGGGASFFYSDIKLREGARAVGFEKIVFEDIGGITTVVNLR